jgi:hypothetical protein
MFRPYSSWARRAAIVGLCAATFLGVQASKWRDEGVAPFGCVMVAITDVELDRVSEFAVWVLSNYSDSARVVARIHLPPGVELVAGDTVHVGSALDSTGTWGVALRFRDSVAVELRGEVRIHHGLGVVDEGAFRFAISPGVTRMHAHSEIVREEHVVQGRRYRYGGKYLVPIDAPQEVTQRLLTARGARARAMDPPGGSLTTRDRTGPDVLKVVVFVDGKGRAVSARVVAGQDASSQQSERARRVAMARRYQPAQYRGRSVPDWVEVGVEPE